MLLYITILTPDVFSHLITDSKLQLILFRENIIQKLLPVGAKGSTISKQWSMDMQVTSQSN